MLRCLLSAEGTDALVLTQANISRRCGRPHIPFDISPGNRKFSGYSGFMGLEILQRSRWKRRILGGAENWHSECDNMSRDAPVKWLLYSKSRHRGVTAKNCLFSVLLKMQLLPFC